MRKAIVWMLLLLCLPGMALGEVITYQDDYNGLHFTLPEGWSELIDDSRIVYQGPQESGGLLLIEMKEHTASDMELMDLDAAMVEKWMREDSIFGDTVFKEITPILFSKATDADGKFYALNMCSFVAQDFPDGYSFLYMQMFFTASDGMIGTMSMVTPAIENDPNVEWFDSAVMDIIPEDIMAILSE